jgi:hypothetical protein
VKRNNALTVNTLPTIPDVNEEIFERAGISKDDRAQLLKKVFHKTVKRIGATNVKVFSSDGEVIYSKPLVDHVTQGKAIEQALHLVGLQKQDAPKVTVKAIVQLPDYANPPKTPKDITPGKSLLDR